MARIKILPGPVEDFIASAIERGVSRKEIVRQARAAGFDNVTERDVQKVRFGGRTPESHAIVNKEAKSVGYKNVEEQEIDRTRREYHSHWQNAKERGFSREEFEERRNDILKTDKQEDLSFDGPFAKYLIDIGLRDPDATYPVGMTPKKVRGGK